MKGINCTPRSGPKGLGRNILTNATSIYLRITLGEASAAYSPFTVCCTLKMRFRTSHDKRFVPGIPLSVQSHDILYT